uniref:DRBM domain-containing protein n=1 Tax=Trichuris muris TaxID=70415 RepID=A0A5S6QA79_TRIMR
MATPLGLFNEKCAILKATAEFQLLCESGAPHEPMFTVSVMADGISVTSSGSSKQLAKQLAVLEFFRAAVRKGMAARWGLPMKESEAMALLDTWSSSYHSSCTASTSPCSSTAEVTNTVVPSLSSVESLYDMCTEKCWPLPLFKLIEKFEESSITLLTVQVTIGPVRTLGTGETVSEAMVNAAIGILDQLKSDEHHGMRLYSTSPRKLGFNFEFGVNAISTLQDKCARNKMSPPRYEEVGEEGLPHMRMFYIAVKVDNLERIGCGRSKKEAKHKGACKMLALLDEVRLANLR